MGMVNGNGGNGRGGAGAGGNGGGGNGGTGHGARSHRSRRRASVRLHPSMLLLLLAVGLLAAAAFQAGKAERSHRATVEKVLTDHAAAAAWTFEQQLHGGLAVAVDHLFSPLHARATRRPGAAPPPASRVLHEPHDDGQICGYERVGHVPFAVRFPLSGGAGEVAGEVPPDVPLGDLRELVRYHARNGRTLTRGAGVAGATIGGRARLVAYSRHPARGDTLLYALVLDSAALAPFFDHVLRQRPLLPTPLTGDRPNTELLAARIGVDGGGAIFQSAAEMPARYAAERPLEAGLGTVTARIGLREELAGQLIIGGPPASRLPLLFGMIGLAIGLLAVGFAQLRRESALARLRSDFVSSVSHELRTPLALQRIFLDMLRLGRVQSEEHRRWSLDTIDREATRLTHLVENVLQFSRAEQRQMRIQPQALELTSAVGDIVEAFRPLAAPAGARLALDLEPGIVASVDPAALRQVLMNLLENAVKYGAEGQTITVALRLEGGRAVLTVDDEGPGIPKRERQAVLEPFRRGSATARTATAGSGIGLAVVRDLVRLHGGAVGIEDAPSGGARLRLELPGAGRGAANGRSADIASPNGAFTTSEPSAPALAGAAHDHG